MARSNVLADVVKVTAQLPWWLSVAIGGGFFYFFKFHVPSQLPEASSGAWIPLYSMLGYVLLGACLVGAAVGGIKRLGDYWTYRRQTSLQSIRSLGWADFERLVTEAFRRQGYSARRTPVGPDGGIDIILRKAGRTTLVQCKQWKQSKVGVKPVRELAGIVAARKADAGIFVCSGGYTREAVEFARASKVELIDGPRLAGMMQIGRYPAQRRDVPGPEPLHQCPRCGSELVRRTARKGRNAGSEFFGCAAFPGCRYTRNA